MNRIWFDRPAIYWYGWHTLLPIQRGHDEYARWTIILGWTITGRVIIAMGDCGGTEESCNEDRAYRDSVIANV